MRHRASLEQRSAVHIAEVIPGTPAAVAGLQRGDVLVSLDGLAVTGLDDVTRLLDENRIGQQVTVQVLRNSRIDTVTVVPDERSA